MKIATYNVLGLTGYPPAEALKAFGTLGSEAHVAHFARIFAALDSDIIAIQEGVAVRLMQQVAKHMGCYLSTQPSPIAWPGHVLSRLPIVESRTFSHIGPDDEVPPFSRTAGAALVEGADGRRLWVVDVHLHPSDVELRAVEGALLRDQIQRLLTECEYVVVLGDFNCEVDEPVHEHLRSLGFANAMEQGHEGGIQATMDTVGIRTHYIDHIYLSPALAPKLSSAQVVRTEGFRHDGPQIEGLWVHSDHLPVVAELDWHLA